MDRPALHRSTSEYMVLETDVASYYPSMMASFGIVPRSLGDCGADLFAEILAERIKIKEQAAAESDPAESQRLKTMADGLKIVLELGVRPDAATRTACCTTRPPSSP